MIIKFSQLLLINISPDPRKRLAIELVKKKYEELFYINQSSKNYLQLINNFQYKNFPINKMKKEESKLKKK